METNRHQVHPLVAIICRPSADDAGRAEFVIENNVDSDITFLLKVSNHVNFTADKYDVAVDVDANSFALALTVEVVMFPITYDLSFEIRPKGLSQGRTTKQVNEDLTLIIDYDQQHSVLAFEVSNQGLHSYSFSFNFTDKGNLQLPGEKLSWEVHVPVKSSQLIVKAGVDGSPIYNYGAQFAVLITDSIHPLASQLPHTKVYGISNFTAGVQKIEDGKFVDSFFPPSYSSVYGLCMERLETEVVWRRPESFLEGEITLFPPNFKTALIAASSQLDTRWLLSVACEMLSDEARAHAIFVTNTVQESGLYRLRLLKDGEWQTVTIDDLIPCTPAGQPISSRSVGSELWLMLLEKAFAKLFGSYVALHQGSIVDAILDLYGLIGIPLDLRQADMNAVTQGLAESVRTSLTGQASFIAVSDQNIELNWRLTSNHPYNVIKAAEYQGELLLNLANPWVSHQWTGDWGSDSSHWTSAAKQALWGETDDLGLSFWMNLKDFISHFAVMYVYSGKKDEQKERSFKSLVLRQGESVLPRSFYKLVLTSQAVVALLLSQESPKNEGCAYLRPNGLSQISLRDSSFKEVMSSTVSNTRDNQLLTILDPGKYFIVPKIDAFAFVPTFKVKKDFPLMSDDGLIHPLFRSTVLDIFKKFSAVNSEVLTFADFRGIAGRNGLELDELQFAADFKARFASTSEGLTREGLLEMFKAEAAEKGEEAVRGMMQSLGYDQSLFSFESRAFKISLFIDELCEFEEMPYSEIGQDISS
jgi:hypothetical protein